MWILSMPGFNFVCILSTLCDIFFSPYFMSKGTTVFALFYLY